MENIASVNDSALCPASSMNPIKRSTGSPFGNRYLIIKESWSM